MDKILELGDVFGHLVGGSVNNFNPVLLIPVVFVIVGAVAVFVYGFQRSDVERPKFRKSASAESSAGGSGSRTVKRKKRVATSAPETIPAAVKSGKKEINAAAPIKVKERSPVPTPEKKLSKTSNINSKTLSKTQSSKAKKLDKKANDISVVGGGVESGEWQTVLNKKQQKKQANNSVADPLIQAVAEVAALAAVNNKNHKIKAADKKVRDVTVTNKKVKKVEQSAVKEPAADIVEPQLPPQPAEIVDANNSYVVSPHASAVLISADDLTTVTTESASITQLVETTPAELVVVPGSNLIFNELEDAEWTETKPQKKNKKRALRE